MTGPFRRDVVTTGFVLAVPVFLLALRGEFTLDDVLTRLLWCLAAGWAVVALLRWATAPPPPVKRPRSRPGTPPAEAEPEPDPEPAPTA